MSDAFDQSLSAAARKQLGRIKGGMTAHAKHPDLAQRAGAAGGRAYVEAHPESKTPSHGRRLALSRRPRWERVMLEKLEI